MPEMNCCRIHSPEQHQQEALQSISCVARLQELGCNEITSKNERRNCSDAFDRETLSRWTTDPLEGCKYGFLSGIIQGFLSIPKAAIDLSIAAMETAKESQDKAYEFFRVCDKSVSCRRLLVAETPHLHALEDSQLLEIPLTSLIQKIQFAKDSAERANTMSKAMRGERPVVKEEGDQKLFHSLTMELIAKESNKKYRQFLCYNSKRAAEMICDLPGEIYGASKFVKAAKYLRPSSMTVDELPKYAVTPSPYGAKGRIGNPLAVEAPEIADVQAFANRFQSERAAWLKANPEGPLNISVPEFKVIVDIQAQELKKITPTAEGHALIRRTEELAKQNYPYEDTLNFANDYTRYVNKMADKSMLSNFSVAAQEYTSVLIGFVRSHSVNKSIKEGVIIYPTVHELGPESINRMVAAGVAPQGVYSKVTTGDGLQKWTPRFFKLHDDNHTAIMQDILRKAAQSPEHREKWAQFFTKLEAMPSPSQRTINELVIFEMKHEDGLLVSSMTQKQRAKIMEGVQRRLAYESQAYGIRSTGDELTRDVAQAITWVEKNMPK